MTTSFCSKVCLIVLAFALWPVSCAWAQKCVTATGDEILNEVKSAPQNSVPTYVDWGPWGGPMSAAIRPPPPEPGDATKAAVDYRIVVETAKPVLLPSAQISAKEIPDTHPWVMAGRAAKGDTLVSFQLPDGTWDWWWPWPTKFITIVGCQNEHMLFHASAHGAVCIIKQHSLINGYFRDWRRFGKGNRTRKRKIEFRKLGMAG